MNKNIIKFFNIITNIVVILSPFLLLGAIALIFINKEIGNIYTLFYITVLILTIPVSIIAEKYKEIDKISK